MEIIRKLCAARALPIGVDMLVHNADIVETRAGTALVYNSPVVTEYTAPTRRIVSNTVRDANPFFHLAESLWMLAGRDDADWLDRYVGDFSSRFAEEGGKLHGAYGARWRRAFGFDQIGAIIERLRRDPGDRQCVLQMWDATTEFVDYGGADDLLGPWKDRPCNTHAYFRVRGNRLDMTVCCRSNDVVWGAYGANSVHFSFLQEYIAASVGVLVGTYYQFSNNYHVYTSVLDTMCRRAGVDRGDLIHALADSYYNAGAPDHQVVTHPETFLDEIAIILDALDRPRIMLPPEAEVLFAPFQNRWLVTTAWNVLSAHRCWTEREPGVDDCVLAIECPAWKHAALTWLSARAQRVLEGGTVKEVRAR